MNPLSLLQNDCDKVCSFIYSLLPRGLLQDSKFISKWLLDKDAEDGFNLSLQHITHLFVHHNYEHLFQNLLASIWNGYKIYKMKGGAFYYCIYFGGGIVSKLPVDNMIFDTISANEELDLVKTAEKYMTSIFHTLGIQYKSLSCGSSGAVFALMGSNLILAIQSLLNQFQSYKSIHKPTTTATTTTTTDKGNFLTTIDWGLLLSIGGNLSTIFVVLHSLEKEWRRVRALHSNKMGTAAVVIPNKTTLSFISLFGYESSTNHMTNVKGFVFGAGATMISWLLGY